MDGQGQSATCILCFTHQKSSQRGQRRQHGSSFTLFSCLEASHSSASFLIVNAVTYEMAESPRLELGCAGSEPAALSSCASSQWSGARDLNPHLLDSQSRLLNR